MVYTHLVAKISNGLKVTKILMYSQTIKVVGADLMTSFSMIE